MANLDPHAGDAAGTEVGTDLTPVLGGEPAVFIGFVVSAVIAILAATGVVDAQTSTDIIVSVAPFVATILTRFFVKPVLKARI